MAWLPCTLAVHLCWVLLLWAARGRQVRGQVYVDYQYPDVDYSQKGGVDYGGGAYGGGDYGGGDYGGGAYGGGVEDYGGGGQDYEYGRVVEQEERKCYACHYSRSAQHEQGQPNCAEPFLPHGIAIVPCPQGSQCAKAKTELGGEGEAGGGGGVMLIRNCMAACRDIDEPGSSVTCCRGSLCNGDRSGAAAATPSHVTTLLAAVTLCHVIMAGRWG